MNIQMAHSAQSKKLDPLSNARMSPSDLSKSGTPVKTGTVSMGSSKNLRAVSKNWVVHQLRGLPQPAPGVLGERRRPDQRRTRTGWSVVYGSFNPRRRTPRRLAEGHYHSVDWYESRLMAVAVGILLLCVGDAFMTLILLSGGAQEINPVMALVVDGSATVFIASKMALTGACVVLMVCLARYRFMRLIRVETALYAVLIGYLGLIVYELALFRALGQPTNF